jgi:hypothetical protein
LIKKGKMPEYLDLGLPALEIRGGKDRTYGENCNRKQSFLRAVSLISKLISLKLRVPDNFNSKLFNATALQLMEGS